MPTETDHIETQFVSCIDRPRLEAPLVALMDIGAAQYGILTRLPHWLPHNFDEHIRHVISFSLERGRCTFLSPHALHYCQVAGRPRIGPKPPLDWSSCIL